MRHVRMGDVFTRGYIDINTSTTTALEGLVGAPTGNDDFLTN